MREIKFRAWDTNDKTMLQVSSLNHAQSGVDSGQVFRNKPDRGFTTGFLNRERCVLMQYTTFKDKYGKEIFEGDICLFGERPAQVIISYKDAALGLQWPTNPSFIPLADYPQETFLPWMWEIIGNIYENPELLPA